MVIGQCLPRGLDLPGYVRVPAVAKRLCGGLEKRRPRAVPTVDRAVIGISLSRGAKAAFLAHGVGRSGIAVEEGRGSARDMFSSLSPVWCGVGTTPPAFARGTRRLEVGLCVKSGLLPNFGYFRSQHSRARWARLTCDAREIYASRVREAVVEASQPLSLCSQ
jgi:hypothetical protein